MGQHLFKVNFEKVGSNNSDVIQSCSEKDKISFLFPWIKTDPENILIKQIRTDLFPLTNSKDSKEIDEILLNEVLTFLEKNSKEAMKQITDQWEKQKQSQISLINQIKEEEENQSIFLINENDNHQKFSYFALQSLISILLILIKSAEKSDPTIIYQIFSLTNQLTEQIPIKSLSSSNYPSYLFISLKPLIIYLEEISLSSDLILSKQSIQILLKLFIAKASFKDILPLLSRLIFDTNNFYDLKSLIIQLNDQITEQKTDQTAFDYLKSIGAYPTIEFDEKQCTGQMISSIILAHIQLNNLFSFEFHLNTLKELFVIIEQLMKMEISDSDRIVNYILFVLIQLFQRYFQKLFLRTTKLYQNIFSNEKQDFIEIVTNEELIKYYQVFLTFSMNEEKENICKESSKILIFILDLKSKSFIENLSLIYQLINENKSKILEKIILYHLNREIILFNWIKILSNDNSAKKILFSFIEIYFNRNEQQIISSFQQILFFQFIEQSKKQNYDLSSLIIEYITYIFQNYPNENEIIKQILIGLSLMIKIDDIIQFNIIQSILPLLYDYILKNPTNNPELIYWLLGKMSRILIINYPVNSLEEKYVEELNSPLFSGGYQSIDIESSPDHQLLMSIYNNKDEGAKLITKMKLSLKTKEVFLQKSIEEQVNDACASLFAVYVKFYRRINLVRSDDEKVHPDLLSLYKYANNIRNIFANLKGQGGDCQEFYQDIKSKCLFLLLSIKENNFIPIIEKRKEKIVFQRQISHWTKAKYVIRLLRNLLNACIRFKKLILQKKNLKFNSQTILHQAIEKFIFKTNHFLLEEFKQTIQRQNQRAEIRLFTYRFIQKISQLNNQDLIIYFYQLINFDYLQNISTANHQLKQDITKAFYSVIKNLLASGFSSEILFYLLNIDYQSNDIFYLFDYQIIQILFKSFVSFINENTMKLNSKFLAFNWFRLLIFQISEMIYFEQLKDNQNEFLNEKIKFIFNDFILNELKGLKQMLSNEEKSKDCLENLTIGWFIHSSNKLSTNHQIELCLNQFLILLLELIYLYQHIRLICSNMDYIEQLLQIYYQCKSISTILITLKILGQLISSLSNIYNEKIIEKFLIDSLNFIGQNSDQNQTNELIQMYRIIISKKSTYQIIAIQFIFNSLNADFNEQLIASLAILGGYIQPFCLASIVKVSNRLAAIVQIDSSSFTVRYLDTNQIELVNIDQLQIENDHLSPLDLLALPNGDSILDKLAEFIQLENNSLRLLEITRRALSALFYLLNNQKIIEIFLQKSYASIIAKLAISQSTNLSPFDKERLEQFYLIQEKNFVDNTNQMIRDENIVECLSTSIWKYHGWKPSASKEEIQLLNQGRLGNNEISIVPIPPNTANADVLEECGNKHRFKGKINSTPRNTIVRFPSFILNNLRVNQGKWYFCVKLNVGGLAQIGWATDGYSPGRSKGIGDDLYSWSYDGSRDVLFHNQEYSTQFNNTRWKANDICGCGIDIDGQNINIKYWLNGKLLGTAFSHQQNISQTSTKCDLLPNGPTTSYFPGITLQSYSTPPTTCEFIFSPEDMNECPLPPGYKPLLMPKLTNIENSIVAYPYSAYLVGDNVEDYFYKSRTAMSKRFLRDFVNECHLETEFNLDEHHQLCLSKNSFGFPLSIDHDLSSFTITFDFQIQTHDDFQLLIFDNISIQIPLDKIEETIRIVIVCHLKEQQIIVYTKNKSQIFNITIDKLNIHLLPKIDAKLSNLAIWKYALSEEHIQRLFTYGIFYISTDYQQRINTFSFSEHLFNSELLVPFDQPFTDEIWQNKKNQFDPNESNYFHSSIIQFYGNKTYLVLDKSKDFWSNYTLILDISIPNWPINNEQLSIVTLNSKAQLYVTHQGKLCLTDDQSNNESKSTLVLNEFIRLLISIEEKSVKIYLNESLEIDLCVSDDRFAAKLNRFDLFREIDLTKNTTNEQTLRIQCQSISFINNRSIMDISPSLIAIGYKESWIKYLIEQNKITNIQMIDTILREQKDKFIKMDFENERKNYFKILSRLSSSIDKETFDRNEQTEFILNHWDYFQTNNHILDQNNQIQSEENKWFWENINEWIRDKTNTTKPIENITSNSNTNQHRRIINLFDDDDEDDDDDDDEDDDDDDDESETRDPFRMLVSSRQGEDFDYKLVDLNQSEQSIEFTSKPDLNSRTDCEHALITMYARYTIHNILTIWSNNSINLFPFDKLGDYTFIIKLLQIMNKHFTHTDEINLLLKSILKYEIEQIDMTLLKHLQKNILLQLIQFIVNPSLLDDKDLNYIFKILNIFVELIKDNPNEIVIQYLFPQSLINLLFDLFLLIPIHQSKIFILRLFSKLIQTNQYFILKDQIHNFLFKLLIELSSNITAENKHFQMCLMDLVILQLIKQDNCIQQKELPENIRHLFIVMNVINVLTDQTKEKSIPDQFFSEERKKLTRDDFDKCNHYFNNTIDQQLIHFINTSPSGEESFENFIENLPNEYEKYFSLSNIPIDCIKIRCEFLYQLNTFIVQILPMIDLNLSSGESFLTDQIRLIKPYLFHQTKFELLDLSLEKTTIKYHIETLRVSFNLIKSSENNTNSENTMFYQAYQQLSSIAHIHFRKKVKQLWQAIYVGMHSIDQGGPYRDSITQICSDICSTRLSLFILCPNGRTNTGLNKDCWIPNVFPPNKIIPDEMKKQYQFIGQLMGMAIRKKHYLDLKFPLLLWKQLLKESITIEDIQAIDLQSFTIINELEKYIEQTISNDDIKDIFSNIISELYFEVVSSNGQTYELIPDGMNIQITSLNFKQYSICYRQYRLNEFQRQIEFIRQGLCSVVPFYFLSLFTPNELEEAVCGKGQIDIELLKRNTQYNDGEEDQDKPHIQRFWTVIGQMFNEEQKKLFLTFVWGRNTLPSRDQDFTMKFTINQYSIDDGDVDKALPRSHTCAFAIDLPEYSTTEIMYERLNYAITYCSSIDGDGTFNDETNTRNLLDDSDSDD